MSAPPDISPLQPPAREAVEALLHAQAGELARMGVTRVALFGSVARGDDDEHSDLDLAIATSADDAAVVRCRVRELIEPLVGRKVDVAPLPMQYPLSELAQDETITVL